MLLPAVWESCPVPRPPPSAPHLQVQSFCGLPHLPSSLASLHLLQESSLLFFSFSWVTRHPPLFLSILLS